MSSYVYDLLSPGSIRLLRLSPSQDEQAPIHCHLFPYPLSSSRTGTHLYEALSYYWGSPEKVHIITVGDASLLITRNLHTALRSLRDSFIERIIWIDAVCINQNDAEEKGRQVQLMAEIFAKASRVVVWLENTTGDPEIDSEAYNDSAQALESIGSFAVGSQDEGSSKEVWNQAVARLLGRAWFRRIWVLQEVAAARHVLIKCYLAEIDGYAFCLGLEEWGTCMDLMDQETHIRIRSTLYLIRAATLRPKRVDSTSARFSLQIWPLMVMVEMYNVREATDRRDKVYALLGMSTDTPNGIVPDYHMSWAELFSRLVRSALHDCMSVDTWDKHETAVIRSKGYVLGRVHQARIANDAQQKVIVDTCVSGLKGRHTWYLQTAAKSIQKNDVVCFLQGASLPTIVRVHDDYCDIIAFAVNPTLYREGIYIATHLRELLSQKAENPAEFLLVWNWDTSSGGFGAELSFESFMIWNGLHCAAPCKAGRLMNVGLLYRALGSEKEAILPFNSIVKPYEDRSVRDHPTFLAAIDALLEIYKADDTLADLDRVEGLELMSNLLHRKEGFDVMNEDLISRIASNPDAEVMKFVLHAYAPQITITESVLVAAAANEISGKIIMELLLDFQGDEITISEKVLIAAAANWELGKAIITLCLERKRDQIVITANVVEAATSMKIKLFLLELENCSFPINERTCHWFISQWELYSYNWDVETKGILRLVASFLKRQTEEIVITGRLARSLLNVDSLRISDWGMANHDKGKNMEVAPHHIGEGVFAMMLGWEGGRVVVTEEAIEAMAKIRPDKEESLRKLGNELLRELT